jgi:FAD/FMN-containing dehydrogenase
LPTAVALQKTNQDIVTLVRFAEKHKISLIPRTAGTSLAGQTVETVLLWMFQNISLRLSLDPIKKK